MFDLRAESYRICPFVVGLFRSTRDPSLFVHAVVDDRIFVYATFCLPIHPLTDTWAAPTSCLL